MSGIKEDLDTMSSIAEEAYTLWRSHQTHPMRAPTWPDMSKQYRSVWESMVTTVLGVHAERNPAIEVQMEKHGISLEFVPPEDESQLKSWRAYTKDNKVWCVAGEPHDAVNQVALLCSVRMTEQEKQEQEDEEVFDFDEPDTLTVVEEDEDDGRTPEQRQALRERNKHYGSHTEFLLSQLCKNAGAVHNMDRRAQVTLLVLDTNSELQFFANRLASAVFGLPNVFARHMQVKDLENATGLVLGGVVFSAKARGAIQEHWPKLGAALQSTADAIPKAFCADLVYML